MSSWATITLGFEPEDETKYDRKVPAGLRIDNGVDEQCWLDDDTFYAMSQGRYQHLRFIEHAENFSSSWFNGVDRVAIAEVNDTGDTATVHVYESAQAQSVERADGVEKLGEVEGRRLPEEDRTDLKDRVEEEYGVRPRIEPVDEMIGPDMVVRTTVEEE